MPLERSRTSPRPAAPPVPSGGAELPREVEGAWAALVPESDTIADGISLTLLERDRAMYERSAPGLGAQVRESTRRHIRSGLESMAGRPGAGHRAAALWRETGRERARQGVPLELVLNAYTLGTRVLWEALVARQRSGLLDVDEHVLLAAGRSVWGALDVQNSLMIEAYRRETARRQRRDLQRQQGTLDALADGRATTPEMVEEAREVLGLPHGADVACVVALYDGSLEEPFVAPEDRLERIGVVSHWHVRGGVYFGLLAGQPLPSEPQLTELLGEGSHGRAALASTSEGLRGYAGAYQLATRAAHTLPPGERRLVAVVHRLPEVLLAGSPQVLPVLLSESVGPLLAQPEHLSSTLMDTLGALLRHDGSPTRAAEDLYCHRNTVNYRVRQIEEITGRSLADPRDKLLLTLGVLAAQVG